jgi:O-antigen ligase
MLAALLGMIRAAGPAYALAVALAVAPVATVLQSKALSPVATLGLLAAVLLGRWRQGKWPWPAGPALWLALALFGWAAVSATWAPEPGRALFTAIQLGGFVALAAAACRAVAGDTASARNTLLLAAIGGLAAGLLVAGLDVASGNAIRLAVRGLSERPGIEVGLKPAASAMALLLPLFAAVPGLPAWQRALGLLAGGSILFALPGEAAKIAVLVSGLVGLLCLLTPKWGPRLVGPAVAMLVLGMPALLGPGLTHGIPAASLPPSSAHRLLIWDFTIQRIRDKPVFGWGMEASRRIPGGGDPAPAATLERFGLGAGAPTHDILSRAARLPLHTHNGPLQIWLELGMVGALLAAMLVFLLGRMAERSARPGVATAMLASAAVTGLLSFGTWQEWWVSAELLGLAALASLPRALPNIPGARVSVRGRG